MRTLLWTMGLLALTALAAPAAWAQPELVARIDGAEIASFSTLDMEAPVGGTDSIVVVLRNEGNEDLVFQETPPVQLSGGFADQYDLVQPALEAGNKLSTNGSTAFRIDFEPQLASAINLNTNIFIFTNADGSPFRLSVNGAVLLPDLSVSAGGEAIASGDAVSLGSTPAGQQAQVDLVFGNDGGGDLIVTNLTADADPANSIGLSAWPGPPISPGATETLQLILKPDAVGPARATVSVESNDPASPFEFVAAGLGLGADGHLDFCGTFAEIEQELSELQDALGLDEDANNDGLPDALSLELIQHEVCVATKDAVLTDATLAAYDNNVLEVLLEADYAGLAEFQQALSALFLIDPEIKTAVALAFGQGGTALGGQYLPAVQQAPSPYAGPGDYDGDGTTNAGEYDNVMNAGGNGADFIAAATNPMDDGQNVEPDPPEPFGCVPANGIRQAAAPPLPLWLALAALGGVAAARRRR